MRSTPAYAGTTAPEKAERVYTFGPPPRTRGQRRRRRPSGSTRSVHPRVRGDNVVPVLRSYAPTRSTPAYAGTTDGHPPPHSRQYGPPPRTRGQRHIRDGYGRRQRSTPAYAGTTLSKPFVVPRIDGPPPRTRGQLRRARAAPGRSRSTPAYAGTTGDPHDFATPDDGPPPRTRGQRQGAIDDHPSPTVHPRVRGDNARNRRRRPLTRGPPPRTRGQRHIGAGVGEELRSTPAYAGTTKES